ncbi:MAG: Asp-tRNA(Asn)/Glu-tRNA(Gln) amidotransferase subunit GatB [Candidatus Zixiibacteriota bacterium]|nr:MAG: Asp-tRNA(Asn)/Glu-tRNA(Gln) amidotransferase subunit GatB [candidate division Zixibacteria bacterium]
MTDKNNSGEYESVIGLEVHAQLRTKTKIFCGCKVGYGAPPNTLTCPVCLGLPGALPVLNKKAVECAILMILAVGGEVQERSVFARKNYFYPDLPKGYQISQYDQPLGLGGCVGLEASDAHKAKAIRLKRIHLEEDAGKLLHSESGESFSRVDLNRCGVPLIEIVTEPEVLKPAEARRCMTRVRQILQYLDVSDADMEKGQLRCDANVSVRPVGASEFGVRTEVKNLNSFRFLEKALAFEIDRQTKLLKSGGMIEQCTMLWNEDRQTVEPMRTKEESEDYRYFPEPDLVALIVNDAWLKEMQAGLPELPDERKRRFIGQYHIHEADAGVLTDSRELGDYYEKVMCDFDDGKLAANWTLTELLRVLHEEKTGVASLRVKPPMLADLLGQIKSGRISGKIAKVVFGEMLKTGRPAAEIIEHKGLTQITDISKLRKVIEEVLAENDKNLRRYLSGRTGVFDYFVGQVMRKTKGMANPEAARKLLQEKLDELSS